MSRRERIDRLLVERRLVDSRERARRLVMAGQVHVGGRRVDKPGTLCDPEAAIEIRGDESPFVSRGGIKLAAALDALAIDVAGRTVLDVGASTGGFTDCVLQRDAASVIAVDVGYGQLAWRLRCDPRVTLLERTNVRYLQAADLPATPDLAVIDVSFISLCLVLPAITPLLASPAEMVALVKPQFEVGRGQVGSGGVVRDPALHRAAIDKVRACAAEVGLQVLGEMESPIQGPRGNREFPLHLRQDAADGAEVKSQKAKGKSQK